jgi:DNA-directed RNA polymerase beta subunit
MERDCVIAHGASLFLRERTFESADQFYVPIHDACGLIAIRKKSGDYYCPRCQKKDKESFGK